MWNKKTTALMIMCNLLFHFCARINMYILNVCHIINKLEMLKCFLIVFVTRARQLYTLYLAAKQWILM